MPISTDNSAPGVYVDEVPPSGHPISGVGTSTAGFVGIVREDVEMPLDPTASDKSTHKLVDAGVPHLVTNWNEFTSKFGLRAKDHTLSQAVYGFFHNGGTLCWVVRIADLPRTWDDSWTTDTHHVKRPLTNGNAPSGFPIKAVADGTYFTAEDDGHEEHEALAYFDTESDAEDAGFRRASTGGTVTPSPSGLESALEAFEAIDGISIVAAPGFDPSTATSLLTSHCEALKDRVFIVDAKQDADKDSVMSEEGVPASTYGALYYPWIVVQTGSESVEVPPSGHIAGIYARSDATRGVHKAPANEAILGAIRTTVPVPQSHQDVLNGKNVNCLRTFDNTVTVYGARTLHGPNDNDLRYISTRRLLIYLRESIMNGTQWVVFEPNTEALWAKIERNVGAFLTTVWSTGALFGSKPKEAFYVRCDATLNTEAVRESGQVITEIGVAIAKPAEFVVFQLSQWSGAGS